MGMLKELTCRKKPSLLSSIDQNRMTTYMKTMLLLILALTSGNLFSQSDTGQIALRFDNKEETEKWLKQNHLAALGISYIENGKIKEISVYGELQAGKPAPQNAVFNVASLTKPVTALVTLKLVDAGVFSLDEALAAYWIDPDIAEDPRTFQLTARHVLSHQTGFPNWRYKNADNKLAFSFDPGTRYQYSGEGFEYLREVLERKFKKSLAELAEELIFSPLEMKDTRFYWDSTMNETRFAQWHNKEGKVYPVYKNSKPNAADDLLTTVEDYSKFLLHIMNGAGLSEKLYTEMTSMQVRLGPQKYFGLGVWIDENVGDGEMAILHGGDDKGVHTMVFILPQTQRALLIFTNSDNGTEAYIPTVVHYLGKAGQDIVDIETR